MLRSIRNVNAIRMMYNNLCHSCKSKVVKNPTMPLDDYCDDCRHNVTGVMEDIKTRIE